jgi:hypothetical protein
MKRAAEKFEAMGSDVLVIPEPQEIIPVGFAESVKTWLQKTTDVEVAQEAQRRLLALQKYVRDQRRQDEVAAACRHCEVKIGELLGPTSQGERSDLNPGLSLANESLTPNERSQFRALAENAEIVERCIDTGLTSRSGILSAIKAIQSNGNGFEHGFDVAGKTSRAIAFLERLFDGANQEQVDDMLQSIIERFESLRAQRAERVEAFLRDHLPDDDGETNADVRELMA